MTGGRRAVVLLSGGLDSAVTLAIARSEGREVLALSFDYGQRHRAELACARWQARVQGAAEHVVVDLSQFGRLVAPGTALVRGGGLSVPHTEPEPDAIPPTYVPARNTVFLAHALALAEVARAGEIWIGANAVDYSGYPDCRPEYLEAFEQVANLGTSAATTARIAVRAPLVSWSKARIVRSGLELGVDFSHTVSCYDPAGDASAPVACGTCPSCRIRRAGFAAAGARDPVPYAHVEPGVSP